jgi:DNA invertase Pin-like site-specific DNA recombinase
VVTVEAAEKVTADHLCRDAYLYVRQSTLRQVMENTTSTQRQYALRQRATALGWPPSRSSPSTTTSAARAPAAAGKGFQRLVADVGMGKAGIVLGLEVSRLARNNADWHRLLEICALTETLILDEDGLYDPCTFNDRLLLGLKGTMSEAELHFMRARLRGGVLSKARRGELAAPCRSGSPTTPPARSPSIPTPAVQQTIRLLFATFARTGSARATSRLRRAELTFPVRVAPALTRASSPGRRCAPRVLRSCTTPATPARSCSAAARPARPRRHRALPAQPRDQWTRAHPRRPPRLHQLGEFEANQTRLAQRPGPRQDRRASPPREGPALLQGLVICAAAASG